MKLGKEVLFLRINENIRRNGEGAFIRLSDGRIMYAYTEFTNGWQDESHANIMAVFSNDEGESWSEKKLLIEADETAGNYMSISLLHMNNGSLGMFYLRKNNDCTTCMPYLVTSCDDGKSWSEPILCATKEAYYVTNNDRVVRSRNGDIYVPVNLHPRKDSDGKALFGKGQMNFFVSRDDGKHWDTASESFTRLPYEEISKTGLQETGLYEFEDGRLWAWSRTDLGCQYECFSEDGGASWSTPLPNPFFSSPASPMQIKKVGKYTLAVFNPIPAYTTRDCTNTWGRSPLVCAVSLDDGKSFTKVFYLEDDLENGYCYPAIYGTEDGVLFAYYHSDVKGMVLTSNMVKKVYFDEIERILSE